MKRFALMLALGLVLVACGAETSATFNEIGSGLDGGGAQYAADAPVATTAAGSEAAADGDGEEGGGVAVDLESIQGDRKVIRQARLELRADDTRTAFDHIAQLAEQAGGFISDATVSPVEGEDDQPEVVMTLRIPADRLVETMASIKGVTDEVISESQGAQDVTDQFIDLEARLTNLGALEVELRALLAEVRQQPDADPDELLRVYTEISSVRGEIEQIQGQLNYLEDVVALATLDITLAPTPAVVPIVEDTWKPVEVARNALRNLVSGLQGVADWGIHFALFTLPMLLLILGLPLVVLFMVHRQWRRKRPSAPPAPTLPAES